MVQGSKRHRSMRQFHSRREAPCTQQLNIQWGGLMATTKPYIHFMDALYVDDDDLPAGDARIGTFFPQRMTQLDLETHGLQCSVRIEGAVPFLSVGLIRKDISMN